VRTPLDRCRFWLLCSTGYLAGALALLVALPALALPTDPIVPGDFLALVDNAEGSGNGTLDLRLVTFSGSDVENDGSLDAQCGVTFPGEPNRCNYDNANTEAAQGGGPGSDAFDESYVTTAGDIQDYYELNFGATTVGDIELVIFLDLNETGNNGGKANNTFKVLDIILNPDSIQGNPDPSGDVSSATQNAINQVFTLGAGSLLAELDPEPAENLPVIEQGAGFADYAIFTGIDPFSLDRESVLLFNFSMKLLNNGGEEIFLSGEFSGSDVPEPSTGLLFSAALVLAIGASRRR
jgi:hypothetical protein